MHLRDRLQRRSQLVNIVKENGINLPGCEVILPCTTQRYLYLDLMDEEHNCAQAWVDADEWATVSEWELPGIAWEQVPLRYLVRWFCHHKTEWWVADKCWTVQHVSIPKSLLPVSLVRLPAKPCPLFCCTWPQSKSETLLISRPWLRTLPFILRYVLGYSRVMLSHLVGMVKGDLIRITYYEPTLCIGRSSISHFCLTQELEVFMEEYYVTDSEDLLREEEEVCFEWMNLPINIEFVLDTVTVTVGELDELKPGSQLPLNNGAEKKIKIYMNRKLFGHGELIVLDDGSLAVEVNGIQGNITEKSG